MKVFLNITNHPSDKWSKEQLEASKELGEKVRDYQFPNIASDISDEELNSLVNKVVDAVMNEKTDAVLVQGEMVFTYRLVKKLSKNNIRCYAAITERVAEEKTNEDGSTTKVAIFKFRGFREY